MLAQNIILNLILERTFPANRQRTDKIGEPGEMTAEHFPVQIKEDLKIKLQIAETVRLEAAGRFLALA